MDASAGVVKFRVAGTAMDDDAVLQLLPGDLLDGAESVKVYTMHALRSSERAAALEKVQVETDIVVVKIANGPTLVLHPDTARALLTSDAGVRRDLPADEVPVTAMLPWSESQTEERGGASVMIGAVLQWFGILRFDPLKAAAQNVARAIAERIDGDVHQGLYQLQPEAIPAKLGDTPPATAETFTAAGKGPLLILVHGTFVDTARTFGKLWSKQKEVVKSLFARYEQRVFAFDHPTLLASPVANALALATALPAGAVIDLVTHSRGGLVAEILVRAAAQTFSQDDVVQHFGSTGTGDGADLMALHRVLQEKHIVVQRVVRIACPARGTLLASARLDAYVSVFNWVLSLAQLHVSSLLMNFLREIAREGTQPKVLPGIAAMEPDSALVTWLNAPIEQVDSSLYVLAGDSSGQTVLGWLKTLMADAFFWTDNDLVVQTRSMYGGVPRKADARFRRFQDGEVSHFTYFSENDTACALAEALQPNPGAAWQPIGPRSLAGKDASGDRTGAQGERTTGCVFVIPDFFGSHLETSTGRRVWLDANSSAEFSLLDPRTAGKLHPAGLIAECYGQLCERLAETHEVVAFAYDWRLPLEEAADQLSRKIALHLDDPSQRGKPIRFIAHGMGGLVLRVLHLTRRDVWDRMMALEDTRILMLGVPQHGTWTPMQALSGDDTFGNTLAVAGPLFGVNTTQQVLARMPGFIQLQAGLGDDSLNLKDRSGWEKLRDAQQTLLDTQSKWHRAGAAWAIPEQGLLDAADRMWRRLDQEAETLAACKEKIVLVAGSAQQTPSGVNCAGSELLLECANEGDGRVTLTSACLPGNKVWRIKAEHGRMPMALPSFGALMELLVTGSSTQLQEDTDPADVGTRSPCKARRFRQARTADPPKELTALFDVRLDDAKASQPDDDRLTVRVKHSDLRFVRLPLIVGHYQSLSLTGSEDVVDSMVNGRMSTALRAGIYPERVGSYQIFDNGQHAGLRRQKQRFIPRPKAAIVVGLGEEGKLDAQHLSYTLRNGILAFAERLAESVAPPPTFDIAATLVGSGGPGVTTGNAALALIQAITDANLKLKDTRWPTLAGLEIVEKYLDRATDAWRVLTAHAQANSDRLVVAPILAEGEGRMRRPLDASYRGAAYDFISAVRPEGAKPDKPVISYSLDTKRARTEVRAQHPQGQLLRDLVTKASNSADTDPLIGRTLFNLLVPVEIEPFLAGSTDMVMELDEHTAALPWEMLETDLDPRIRQAPGMQRPWAIRCKVIRKLQATQYRTQIVDASVEDNILIIGQPKVDDRYGPLPGAQSEADAIAKAAKLAIGAAPGRVTLLASANDAHSIINQLFARSYRMVHIAGHGKDGPNGGVVLSGKDTYLGGAEIAAMRVTPELVFINCCHLAQLGKSLEYDRVTFAATIAEALIKIGVRCVVAAGWAVDDTAAKGFATSFYTALFGGARFIDAVGAGRKAAWQAKPDSKTWAAYQCYGDPDWRFRTGEKALPPAPKDEFAGIASSSTLILVLESIRVDALFTTPTETKRHRERLEYLAKKFEPWTKNGDVAEHFGNAYAALPDSKAAIEWFKKAASAADGLATLQAMELLAEQMSLPGAGETELRKAVEILQFMLIQLDGTLRRHAIIGNAYKRLSAVMWDAKPRRDEDAEDFLKKAIEAYTVAKTAKPLRSDLYNFYPPRAILECKLRRWMLSTREMVPENWCEEEIIGVENLTDHAAQNDPDFFSIVGQTQLDLIKAVIRRRLHRVLPEIQRSLVDLKKRIPTQWFWMYVHDDAQFLLQPYIDHIDSSDTAERFAAQALLKQLQEFRRQPDDVTA